MKPCGCRSEFIQACFLSRRGREEDGTRENFHMAPFLRIFLKKYFLDVPKLLFERISREKMAAI